MDPAIIGSMRVGHFRIGVKLVDFDRLVDQLEKTSTPTKIMADSRVIEADGPVIRANVFIDLFDRIKTRVETV